MKARSYHTFFTDRFLPGLFFETPDKFVEEMRKTGTASLQRLWRETWRPEFGDAIPPGNCDVVTQPASKGATIVVLSLTAPVAVGESALVGVFHRPGRLRLVLNRISRMSRFFLLTASDATSQRGPFVMREMISQGREVERGRLTQADVGTFTEAVRGVCMCTVGSKVYVDTDESGCLRINIVQGAAYMA